MASFPKSDLTKICRFMQKIQNFIPHLQTFSQLFL